MISFYNILQSYSWEEISHKIHTATRKEVEYALGKPQRNIDDFLVLLSPAAENYLEEMAQKSKKITQQRFGKTIHLYAPMYLSNECQNICTYCGYSFTNKIPRKTLTNEELIKEALAIKEMGIDHVLLVTGEANKIVHTRYMLNALQTLKPYFSIISFEVQPLETSEYQELQENGTYAVLVYQETYHEATYKSFHPKGKKSNFQYRLATPERLGHAKMHKIGLGVLLGLEDWRTDSFFCGLHLDFMQKNFWQSKYSVSFPRIRPAEGVDLAQNRYVSDKNMVQLICAYRLVFPDVEISVSTREEADFRERLIHLGVTSMSAGSKTNPGGYAVEIDSLEQFEIDDSRSPQEFAKVITQSGYEPVFKDWFHISG